MTIRSIAAAVLGLALVSGCSGGGGGITPPSVPAAPGNVTPAGVAHVTIQLRIPAPSAPSATKRSPKFVSPATNYVVVTTYNATGTLYDTVTTNVSPGAAGACTTNSDGSRTCPIAVDAPANSAGSNPGQDTIDFTTYASNPAATPAPSPLGYATVMQAIGLDQANTINAVLGGIPNSLQFVPLIDSADVTQNHSYRLGLTARDAANEIIIAGVGTNDPYADSVQVTCAVTGGTGASVTFATTTGTQQSCVTGSTAILMYSADYVTVTYTALDASLQYATFSASVVPKSGTPAGAGTATSVFSVITASATAGTSTGNATFTPSTTAGTFDSVALTGPNSSQGVTLTEVLPGGDPAATFTATVPATCAGIATVTGSGTTFTISAVASNATAGVCNIVFTDQNGGTATIAVDRTVTSSSIDVGTDGLYAASGDGSFAQIYDTRTAAYTPVLNPDVTPGFTATGIANAPGGTFYLSNGYDSPTSANNTGGGGTTVASTHRHLAGQRRPFVTANPSYTPMIVAYSLPAPVAAGAPYAATATPIVGTPALSSYLVSPIGLALDANNLLYIADDGANAIFKIDPSTGAGKGTVYVGPSAATAPVDVAVDKAGNMYAMLANGTINEYSSLTPDDFASEQNPTGANAAPSPVTYTYPNPDPTGASASVAVDSLGNVFEAVNGQIYAYSFTAKNAAEPFFTGGAAATNATGTASPCTKWGPVAVHNVSGGASLLEATCFDAPAGSATGGSVYAFNVTSGSGTVTATQSTGNATGGAVLSSTTNNGFNYLSI